MPRTIPPPSEETQAGPEPVRAEPTTTRRAPVYVPDSLLPDSLPSGTVIKFLPSGILATLTRTSQKDYHDCPLYAVRYQERVDVNRDGRSFWMPAITSSVLRSRDDLQEMGAELVEG